jgi:hypothetical protein
VEQVAGDKAEIETSRVHLLGFFLHKKVPSKQDAMAVLVLLFYLKPVYLSLFVICP